MEDEQRDELVELLEFDEDRAGGFMTTFLVTATPDEPVADVRARLAEAERTTAPTSTPSSCVDDAGPLPRRRRAVRPGHRRADDQTMGDLLGEPRR